MPNNLKFTQYVRGIVQGIPPGTIIGRPSNAIVGYGIKRLARPGLMRTGLVTGTGASGSVGGTASGSGAQSGAGEVGMLGQYVEASRVQGSALGLTTNMPADLASISLTAGDWDVDGTVAFAGAGGAILTIQGAWVSNVSATVPTFGISGLAVIEVSGGSTTGCLIPTGPRRFNLGSTTTIYLSCQAVFTVGTVSAYGEIRARLL
jgi:hypothetical protein